MEEEEFNKLKELVYEVAYSNTKADAKSHLQKLEFKASFIKPDISAYAVEKLSTVVNYANQASGQVQNKDHRIRNLDQAWAKFRMAIKNV